MIFAKLDVCFWRHKKFKRAGAAAAGYWAAALAYLREDESKDGLLERDVLGQLLDVGDREALKFCERLVDVGLFEPHDRGYVLLGYTAKNETRDQIEARRTATRDRVNSWRSARRNAVTGTVTHDVTDTNVTLDGNESSNKKNSECNGATVPGSGSGSGSGSDLREGMQGGKPPHRLNASADGANGMTVDAWAEGIRAVTGKPFAPPRGGALQPFLQAMAAHCPPEADRVSWARQEGEAYAEAKRGTALNAFGFLDWLNSDKPSGVRPIVSAVTDDAPHRKPVPRIPEPDRAAVREYLATIKGGNG